MKQQVALLALPAFSFEKKRALFSELLSISYKDHYCVQQDFDDPSFTFWPFIYV